MSFFQTVISDANRGRQGVTRAVEPAPEPESVAGLMPADAVGTVERDSASHERGIALDSRLRGNDGGRRGNDGEFRGNDGEASRLPNVAPASPDVVSAPSVVISAASDSIPVPPASSPLAPSPPPSRVIPAQAGIQRAESVEPAPEPESVAGLMPADAVGTLERDPAPHEREIVLDSRLRGNDGGRRGNDGEFRGNDREASRLPDVALASPDVVSAPSASIPVPPASSPLAPSPPPSRVIPAKAGIQKSTQAENALDAASLRPKEQTPEVEALPKVAEAAPQHAERDKPNLPTNPSFETHEHRAGAASVTSDGITPKKAPLPEAAMPREAVAHKAAITPAPIQQPAPGFLSPSDNQPEKPPTPREKSEPQVQIGTIEVIVESAPPVVQRSSSKNTGFTRDPGRSYQRRL